MQIVTMPHWFDMCIRKQYVEYLEVALLDPDRIQIPDLLMSSVVYLDQLLGAACTQKLVETYISLNQRSGANLKNIFC